MSVVDVVGELSPPGITRYLRDIKHCWVISPYFFPFRPFQNSHLPLFPLPPPIPLPSLFFKPPNSNPFLLGFLPYPFSIARYQALLGNFPLFLHLPALSELPHLALFFISSDIPSAPFLPGLSPLSFIHLLTKLQTLSKPKKKKNDKERGISSIIPFK